MKIKLPVQTKELVKGQIVKKESEKEFDLDTSLASEIRWEAKFPDQSRNEDLFSYTQRIQKNEGLSAPIILSKMKALYCWFDTDVSFIDFVKMFDLADAKYTEHLTHRIQEVWEAIQGESVEKNL